MKNLKKKLNFPLHVIRMQTLRAEIVNVLFARFFEAEIQLERLNVNLQMRKHFLSNLNLHWEWRGEKNSNLEEKSAPVDSGWSLRGTTSGAPSPIHPKIKKKWNTEKKIRKNLTIYDTDVFFLIFSPIFLDSMKKKPVESTLWGMRHSMASSNVDCSFSCCWQNLANIGAQFWYVTLSLMSLAAAWVKCWTAAAHSFCSLE